MTAARWRPRLAESLAIIGEASPEFRDDWWIIGSAAAALAGADIVEVRDVDLLLSEGDARRLSKKWASGFTSAAPASDQFRSATFIRFEQAPLAIEAFGGFELKVRGQWRRIQPLTREARGAVFTPSVAEQIALLEAMGRAKDRPRIVALGARL